MVPAKSICFAAIISCVGLAWGGDTVEKVEVSEVIRTHDGGGFTCKVKEISGVGPVRVRVGLRGIKANGDAEKVKEADAFAAGVLADAGRIVLRNVRMRNYFRVEADVDVDGESLADKLVSSGFCEKEVKEEVKQGATRETGVKQSAMDEEMRRFQGAARRVAPVRTVDPVVQMKEVVDLSRLTTETTFEEALEMLRKSVNPPLPLVVMWGDIEDSTLVQKSTPIGIEGFGRCQLGQALMLILKSVGAKGGALEHVNEGGIVTVASEALGLGDRRYARVYNAGEILAAPAGLGMMNGLFGGGGGYGGMGGMGGMGMGGMGMGGMGMGGMGGPGGGYGGYGSMGGYGGGGLGGGYGGYGGNTYGSRSSGGRRSTRR